MCLPIDKGYGWRAPCPISLHFITTGLHCTWDTMMTFAYMAFLYIGNQHILNLNLNIGHIKNTAMPCVLIVRPQSVYPWQSHQSHNRDIWYWVPKLAKDGGVIKLTAIYSCLLYPFGKMIVVRSKHAVVGITFCDVVCSNLLFCRQLAKGGGKIRTRDRVSHRLFSIGKGLWLDKDTWPCVLIVCPQLEKGGGCLFWSFVLNWRKDGGQLRTHNWMFWADHHLLPIVDLAVNVSVSHSPGATVITTRIFRGRLEWYHPLSLSDWLGE